jgi:eukaryotic-like serine/threonine-protein kinase
MWRLGNYTVLGRIARGSTADVLVAVDPRGRRVALKQLYPHLATDDAHVRRFLDEVRLQSSLRHPHIVAVHDLDEDEAGPFAVLDLVDGPTLAGWLRLGGPLSSTVVASLAAQLTSALVLLEQQGMVHRDINPPNIVVDRSGNAKLIDFGVARRLADGDDRLSPPTTAGSRRGRLRYQYLGAEPAAGDMFSLALCLMEARAGVHALVPSDAGDEATLAALRSMVVRDEVPIDALGRAWLPVPPRATAWVRLMGAAADAAVIAAAVADLGLPSLRLQ